MRYVSSIEEITQKEIGLKMIEEQISLEIIAQCTGLSISEVEPFAIEQIQ